MVTWSMIIKQGLTYSNPMRWIISDDAQRTTITLVWSLDFGHKTFYGPRRDRLSALAPSSSLDSRNHYLSESLKWWGKCRTNYEPVVLKFLLMTIWPIWLHQMRLDQIWLDQWDFTNLYKFLYFWSSGNSVGWRSKIDIHFGSKWHISYYIGMPFPKILKICQFEPKCIPIFGKIN